MLPSERTCSILLEFQKPFSEEFLRECYGGKIVDAMAKATALIQSDGTYPIRHALTSAANTGSRLRNIKHINQIEKETSWKVEIISGLRSKEAQIQLKRDNPRNAAVNKSRHVLGRAVDLILYKREGFRIIQLRKGSSKSSWLASRVPEIAKRYGLLWGGTYKNYHDPVHFEVN